MGVPDAGLLIQTGAVEGVFVGGLETFATLGYRSFQGRACNPDAGVAFVVLDVHETSCPEVAVPAAGLVVVAHKETVGQPIQTHRVCNKLS